MNMSLIFLKVNYGAIDADDTECQGYYIIRFSSSTYKLQDDLNIDGQFVYYGEMVCEGNYFPRTTTNSHYYVSSKIKYNCIFEDNY